MFEIDQEQIRQICRAYGVRRLEIFGSYLREDFSPERSDLDFFVDFGNQPAVGSFRRYMGFKLELEALLGRPVDLIEPKAVTNRFFLSAITDRREVYAA